MSAAIRRRPFLLFIPLLLAVVGFAVFLVRAGIQAAEDTNNPNEIVGSPTVRPGEAVDLVALFVDEGIEIPQEGSEESADVFRYSFEWDLGDGPATITDTPVKTAVFNQARTYLVKATRKVFSGTAEQQTTLVKTQETKTFSITVSSNSTSPSTYQGCLTLSVSPESPTAGEYIQFSIAVVWPQALRNVTFRSKAHIFNFGASGSLTSSTNSVKRGYWQAGDFTVTPALVAQTNEQPSRLVRLEGPPVTFTVSPVSQVGDITLSVDPDTAETGQTVTLAASVADAYKQAFQSRKFDFVHYTWELGDGRVRRTSFARPGLASGQPWTPFGDEVFCPNIQVTDYNPGTYQAKVHISGFCTWWLRAYLLGPVESYSLARVSPSVTISVGVPDTDGVYIISPTARVPRVLLGRQNVWKAQVIPPTPGQWEWLGLGDLPRTVDVAGDTSTLTFFGKPCGPVIEAKLTPSGPTPIPAARLSDKRTITSFGLSMKVTPGPQDDAIEVLSDQIRFLVRSKVSSYGALDPESTVRWSLENGLARVSPTDSRIFNGEAFVTAGLPLTSGTKARLKCRTLRLFIGGEEIPWGPPDPQAVGQPYTDYEKPSPELRFYSASPTFTVGESAEVWLFSLNERLQLPGGIQGARITFRQAKGDAILSVLDPVTNQPLFSTDAVSFADLSSHVADGDLRFNLRAVKSGEAEIHVKHFTDELAALVLLRVRAESPSGGGGGDDDGVGGPGGGYFIRIEPPQNTEIYPGTTLQFTAPRNPANAAVTWLDQGPVAVDANGLVTGTGVGDATIGVQAAFIDPNGTPQILQATYQLTVSQPISKFVLPQHTVYEGHNFDIEVQVYPGTTGGLQNWQDAGQMQFITLAPGNAMNQTVIGEDGRTWRKANATISVGQLPSASPAYFNGQITYVAALPGGGSYSHPIDMRNRTVQMNPLNVAIGQSSSSQIDKRLGAAGRITATATPGDGVVTAWYINNTLYQADDPNADISYPAVTGLSLTGQPPNQTLTMTFAYTARNCGIYSLWPLYTSGTATRASQSPQKVRVFESPVPSTPTDPNPKPTLPSVTLSVTSGGTVAPNGTVLVAKGAQVTFSAGVSGGKDSQGNTPTWVYHWGREPEQPGGGNSSVGFAAGGGTSDTTVTCQFNEVGTYSITCWVAAANAPCLISLLASKATLVPLINLRVDTNRNGCIDDGDDAGEDTWSLQNGAIVLVNNDDDNDDNKPDNSNEQITTTEAPGDIFDLTMLVVKKAVANGSVFSGNSKARLVLRYDSGMSRFLRIFDGLKPGSNAILSPTTGQALGDQKFWEVPGTKLGSDLALLCEGLHYIGQDLNYPGKLTGLDADFDGNNDFDGQITITLAFQEKRNNTWVDVDTDTVKLGVAPLVLAWNGQTPEKVYATRKISDALTAVLPGTVPVAKIDPYSYLARLWPQDYVEIANHYAFGTGTNIPVIFDLRHRTMVDDGQSAWSVQLPNNENVYGRIEVPHDGNGGNIEVTPPLPGYALGRVVLGSAKTLLALKQLVRQQGIQVSDSEPFHVPLDTGWLCAGHVDEVVSFVPTNQGFAVIVASPGAAARAIATEVDNVTRANDLEALKRLLDREIQVAKKKSDGDLGTGKMTLGELLCKSSSKLKQKLAAGESTLCALPEFSPQQGDVLTIEQELVYVSGGATLGNDQIQVQVQRGMYGTNAVEHSSGVKVSIMSDLLKENLTGFDRGAGQGWSPGPYQRIDRAINGYLRDNGAWEPGLKNYLAPGAANSVDIRELPVIFFRSEGTKYDACSPNVVNLLYAGGKAIMADIGGDGAYVFKNAINLAMTGVPYVHVDAWDLHLNTGGVHCASNARRQRIRGTEWWEARAVVPGN